MKKTKTTRYDVAEHLRTPEEMAACIPYLHRQIAILKPKIIVALGATAVDGLLGKTLGITKLRGNWQTYRGIPLMPTYHPAYLLRNQSLSEKRKVWEDMLKVMERLGLPISEKDPMGKNTVEERRLCRTARHATQANQAHSMTNHQATTPPVPSQLKSNTTGNAADTPFPLIFHLIHPLRAAIIK